MIGLYKIGDIRLRNIPVPTCERKRYGKNILTRRYTAVDFTDKINPQLAKAEGL
jgi:hypothetical protein